MTLVKTKLLIELKKCDDDGLTISDRLFSWRNGTARTFMALVCGGKDLGAKLDLVGAVQKWDDAEAEVKTSLA